MTKIIIPVLSLLIFLSGCYTDYDISTVLTGIPDAENVLFTADGRMFVTGGLNIYQVRKNSNGTFYKTSMYSGLGNFCGIVQKDNYLYTVAQLSDGRNVLFDAKIPTDTTKTPQLREIYQFSCNFLNNGMEIDGSGNLYIADTIYAKITRVKVTYNSQGNAAVTSNIWMDRCDGLSAPNGIVYRNNTLYFSESNTIKSVPIKTDGTHGNLTTVYTAAIGVSFDDPCYYEDGLLVPDFNTGCVMYVSLDGTEQYVVMSAGTFAGPSSVTRGTGSMFTTDQFLVTEKGIMFDFYSIYGNKLTVVTGY